MGLLVAGEDMLAVQVFPPPKNPMEMQKIQSRPKNQMDLQKIQSLRKYLCKAAGKAGGPGGEK